MKAVRDRDCYMDNLKGVLIFLVVFGHFLLSFVEVGVTSRGIEAIYYFIYFFHMPMFVFVSGYFSKNVDRCRETAFRRLFVPYLFFNTAMVFYAYHQGLIHEVYVLTPVYVYWYFLALFVWRFLLKDVIKIKYALTISVVAGLAVGFLSDVTNFLSMSRVCAFLPFFLMGYYFDQKMLGRIRSIQKHWTVIGLALVFSLVWYVVPLGIFSNARFTCEPYLIIDDFYFRIAFYIFAVVIGFCVLNLCPEKKTFITGMGAASLSIFVLHRYFSLMFDKVVPAYEWRDSFLIFIVFASIALCYLLSRGFVKELCDAVANPSPLKLFSGKGIAAKDRWLVPLCLAILAMSFLVPWYSVNAMRGPEVTSLVQEDSGNRLPEVISQDLKSRFESAVCISFVGDILLLEDQVKNGFDRQTESYEFSDIFKYTKKYLEEADYAIGGLELPLAGPDSGYSTSNFGDGVPLYLNAPDQLALDMKDAGFDLVTTANNHALDKKVKGLVRTTHVLSSLDLSFVGTHEAREDKVGIIKDINGLKVGFVAYTQAVNNFSESELRDAEQYIDVIQSPEGKFFQESKASFKKDIEQLEKYNPDVIIALPHMGTQFSHSADDFSKTWAKIMFEHGVDIVLASSSHAVQPVEEYSVTLPDGQVKNGLVVFSPGNFVNAYSAHNGDAGAIVNVYLDVAGSNGIKGPVIGASLIPLWIHSPSGGLSRPIPVHSILTNRRLRATISEADFLRVKEVQDLVTTTMLGRKISADQSEEKYYYIMGEGYKRQLRSAGAYNVERAAHVDTDRKMLHEILMSSAKTIVLGDSISAGSNNGGCPWFEPLEAMFPDNKFVNHSYGGATSVEMLKKLDDILSEKADAFIIALGTNDVRYRDRDRCAMTASDYINTLSAMRSEIIQKNPGAKFVFINAWLAYYNDIHSKLTIEDRDALIDKYNASLKVLCAENGDIYIDANSAIRKYFRVRSRDDYILDHIHPSALKGVLLYCDAVLYGDVVHPKNYILP